MQDGHNGNGRHSYEDCPRAHELDAITARIDFLERKTFKGNGETIIGKALKRDERMNTLEVNMEALAKTMGRVMLMFWAIVILLFTTMATVISAPYLRPYPQPGATSTQSSTVTSTDSVTTTTKAAKK